MQLHCTVKAAHILQASDAAALEARELGLQVGKGCRGALQVLRQPRILGRSARLCLLIAPLQACACTLLEP